MARITALHFQRTIITRLLVSFAIFAPFLTRQAWLLIRQDYFSISGMPFSHLIIEPYGFFLSSLAFYVFLIGAALCTVGYLVGLRRLGPISRTLARLLNPLRSPLRLRI